MASTYTRPDSPFIHLRFKDASGKWKSKKTGYRKDNFGDVRQAEKLAAELAREERVSRTSLAVDQWDDWVDKWLESRYGNTEGATLKIYRRYWRRFRAWLLAEKIRSASQLTFNNAMRYRAMREEGGTTINTIIHELKFLGVVMNEAIRRGFATHNPCHKMGIQRTEQKHKDVWTEKQIATVAAKIHAQPDWMQATFILGLYQAARLRQCEVPLRDIDLKRRRIVYWKTLGGRPLSKGNKPFAQPIAESALPLLTNLVRRREAAGHESLCDIPATPSLDWRHFLDSLGFKNISHHGLRATWITRAALNRERISREEAMRFVNHGSTSIHEIYQRLNADDVAHVADALSLPVFRPPKQTRAPKLKSARKSSA